MQELEDVRALCDDAGDRPVILFNMKLQTLRGDFGLPAFPPKVRCSLFGLPNIVPPDCFPRES